MMIYFIFFAAVFAESPNPPAKSGSQMMMERMKRYHRLEKGHQQKGKIEKIVERIPTENKGVLDVAIGAKKLEITLSLLGGDPKEPSSSEKADYYEKSIMRSRLYGDIQCQPKGVVKQKKASYTQFKASWECKNLKNLTKIGVMVFDEAWPLDLLDTGVNNGGVESRLFLKSDKNFIVLKKK